MPRVDFYILENSDPSGRLRLACRLIEKAYKNRHRIYINAENETQAKQLDELLWTYREDSFLPHNLYGDGPELAPPIQIGYLVTPEKHRDILLNLSKAIPDFYQQFVRVLEIVSNDTEIQHAARENYKHYRTQGHDINTHKLQTVD